MTFTVKDTDQRSSNVKAMLVCLSSRRKKPEQKPAVQQQQQQTYVKKPLNAYMLFLKEQRPHVKAEIKSKGGNAVIAFLVAEVRTFDE